MRSLSLIIFIMIAAQMVFAQSFNDSYSQYGKLMKLKLESSPFPHVLRADGHKYDGKIYPFKDHYDDNSVNVFLPKYFQEQEKLDLVFYFHGWHNNIDSCLSQFQLIEQFYSSNKNAILVLVEASKNAPDSFGGKLEEKDGFLKLMNELVLKLTAAKIIQTKEVGSIILSGHSGAYRIISFILNSGGLTNKITEVYLFDALYGQLEKFTYWIDHYRGKFINIYTDEGGTKSESELLINDLNDWNISYVAIEEEDITDEILKNNINILIHSKMGHNDVINKKENFYRFLKNSTLK